MTFIARRRTCGRRQSTISIFSRPLGGDGASSVEVGLHGGALGLRVGQDAALVHVERTGDDDRQAGHAGDDQARARRRLPTGRLGEQVDLADAVRSAPRAVPVASVRKGVACAITSGGIVVVTMPAASNGSRSRTGTRRRRSRRSRTPASSDPPPAR